MSKLATATIAVAGVAVGVGATILAYRNRDRIIGTAAGYAMNLCGMFEMPAEVDDLEPYERDLAGQPVSTVPTSGGEALFRNAS